MALSKRLFAIYRMVEKGSIPADIGCDHGLLSIALVTNKQCLRVYACDLRKGPLARAASAIEAVGLQEQIPTLLRNGIDDLPRDVDTIIIAGMGFDTIKGILEQHVETLGNFRRIIIQSNKHVDEVRRWISEHHYKILEEDLVEEDHFYEIIAFQAAPGEPLQEDEILFGRLHEHPLFRAYWAHRLTKIEQILDHMPSYDHHYSVYVNLHQRIQEKLAATT